MPKKVKVKPKSTATPKRKIKAMPIDTDYSAEPRDPLILCKNCKNFYSVWVDNYTGGGGVEFYRCKVKVDDPVNGGKVDPQCLNARYIPELCGMEGKWYKPLKPNGPPEEQPIA